MIPNAHKQNFETLRRAALHGELALMECRHATTGRSRYVLCAVNRRIVNGQDEYEFVPLGRLFNGNPYRFLVPPNPGDQEESHASVS